MRGLSFVCIAVVLFSVFCIGYCFADGVSVNASVDRSNITIGDPINYTITIKKDALLEIELPEIDFGKLEVKDFREENPSEDILDLKYILTSFEVGEFTIPEAAIKYSGGEVKTKAIAIEVVSVLKEEEEYSDIKDLKEQYVIPSEWWIYLIIALAVVALAVAAVFASNYVKRRYFSKEDIVKEVIPLRPPHEVAYEELEVLKKSSLLKEEKIKEYYTVLSDIIRRYIYGRYSIVAIDRTTEEVYRDLKRKKLKMDYLSLVKMFLDECDLVKFAKHKPIISEIEGTFNNAERFVDLTKEEMVEANVQV